MKIRTKIGQYLKELETRKAQEIADNFEFFFEYMPRADVELFAECGEHPALERRYPALVAYSRRVDKLPNRIVDLSLTLKGYSANATVRGRPPATNLDDVGPEL